MSTFNGFQSPNFTQIPNEYLDYTFSPECDLSKVQMQIMNFVFRETFGWQDKHKILIFSATDIMALLDIKKKSVITNALNGLVEGKKFLESIDVSSLSKRLRANIEKSLKRTLHPQQKIYRLNLLEGKKRAWDNVEKPHTDIPKNKEGNQTVPLENDHKGNQTVPLKGNQMVPLKSNQTVPLAELESVGTLGANESLKKGLNKDLNKKEEEEEGASSLLDNPSLKTLNDLAVKFGFSEDDSMEIVSQVNDMKIVNLTEEVIEDSLRKVEDEQKRNYIKGNVVNWTAVKIQKVANGPKLNIEPKSPEIPKNPKKPQIKYGSDKSKYDFNRHTRTEMVPDWKDEAEAEEAEANARKQEEAAKVEVNLEERKRKLEENLKKLKAGHKITDKVGQV